MRSRLFMSVLAILLCVVVRAQVTQIHGQVMHNNEPLAKANVVEIDANHRVINQTLTDAAGYFMLTVSGEKTSVRVTFNGMRKYTHKIGTRTTWKISLDKETNMHVGKVQSRYETTKLFVGHLQGRVIPQIAWLEQLTDTTFCIVIPVRASNGVEEYPKGRRMQVQNYNGHIMASGVCIEETIPEEGVPQSYDPYIRTSTNNSADNLSQFTTDNRDYYCYPRFLFTKSDLEYLIDHSTELACFAVDTAKGDNYWLYYKGKNFAKELQKILNKMLR